MRDDDNWFTCPNCGEQVPGGALSCPACGSDEETGWSEDAAYDDLDLPVPYDEEESAGAGKGWRLVYGWVAVPVVIALVWLLLR